MVHNGTQPRFEKYERVAMCILESPTLAKAAEKAGIGRTTIYAYLRDPNFLLILDALRAEVTAGALTQLTAQSEAAAQVVVNLMHDQTAPAGVRLAAASRVLELARVASIPPGDRGADLVGKFRSVRYLLGEVQQ